MIPRYKGRYVKWTSEDYDRTYFHAERCEAFEMLAEFFGTDVLSWRRL